MPALTLDGRPVLNVFPLREQVVATHYDEDANEVDEVPGPVRDATAPAPTQAPVLILPKPTSTALTPTATP